MGAEGGGGAAAAARSERQSVPPESLSACPQGGWTKLTTHKATGRVSLCGIWSWRICMSLQMHLRTERWSLDHVLMRCLMPCRSQDRGRRRESCV